MTIPVDPGTGLQDNVKEPIKVGGVTGLHARFKPLYDMFDGAIDTDNFAQSLQDILNELQGVSLSVVPVGTILPFYDFNALVAFDGNLFKYCDGSGIVDADSPLNGQTIPDLSRRYLVGFGTDGGGNIDSDGWDTAPVGNINHLINLQHSHTVDSHTHTGPSHTHNMGNHTHSGPSHFHDVVGNTAAIAGGGTADFSTGAGTLDIDPGDPNIQGQHTHGINFSSTLGGGGATSGPSTNTTGSGGTGDTGSTSPGTDNQLSTAQSIQPRSVRVRYIMRYK